MLSLSKLFEGHDLTASAQAVLKAAESLIGDGNENAAYVLHAVIQLDDDFAAAKILHDAGMTKEESMAFLEPYSAGDDVSDKLGGLESLTAMTRSAIDASARRSVRRSIGIVELVVGVLQAGGDMTVKTFQFMDVHPGAIEALFSPRRN